MNGSGDPTPAPEILLAGMAQVDEGFFADQQHGGNVQQDSQPGKNEKADAGDQPEADEIQVEPVGYPRADAKEPAVLGIA